jgi:serine/threonine protein kinase
MVHSNIVRYYGSWLEHESPSQRDSLAAECLPTEQTFDEEGSEEEPQSSHTHVQFSLYIQMELCRFNLQEWIEKRNAQSFNDPATLTKDAFRIFTQIVSAVEYLHWKGCVHRDIKPGNIYWRPHAESTWDSIEDMVGQGLDKQGLWKLGDFGLVTALFEDFFAVDETEQRLKTMSVSVHRNSNSLFNTQHTKGIGTLTVNPFISLLV